MPGELLRQDVERHTIEGVPVPIFNVPRTLSECFKYQRIVGLAVAVEALGEALRKKRAPPAAIAAAAEKVGGWKVMRPYLGAMTVNGQGSTKSGGFVTGAPSQFDNEREGVGKGEE